MDIKKWLLNRETLNVVQMSFGFFLMFFAANAQDKIEEVALDTYTDKGKIPKHSGYISLATMYGVFTFANFLAPPIINIIKAKWALVVGSLCYALFLVGFLFVNSAYLFGSSALLGFGASLLWTGQGNYLTLNSTKETATKHSGIFWAVFQTSNIFGGIFLLCILQNIKNDKVDIPESTVNIMYGVFTSVNILGVVVLAFLSNPNEIYNEKITTENNQTHIKVLKSTFTLLKTKRMLLLAIVFMFTGIGQSFWGGILPTSLAQTKKFSFNSYALTALYAILLGFGEAIGGLIFGILPSYKKNIRSNLIVLLGTVLQVLMLAIVYINIPRRASIEKTYDTSIIYPQVWLALVCGFIFGFADACWNTHLCALLITKFSDKSAQAFSLFKFFQSLMSTAEFFYATKLELHWHIIILLIFAILGCICYFLAEKI